MVNSLGPQYTEKCPLLESIRSTSGEHYLEWLPIVTVLQQSTEQAVAPVENGCFSLDKGKKVVPGRLASIVRGL